MIGKKRIIQRLKHEGVNFDNRGSAKCIIHQMLIRYV